MKSLKLRVLCIDNRASSNLAVYLLERAGFEVRTTNSIADAKKLARHEPFDLHLLNHELVDGSEIYSCDKLDEFIPRTPILFYSTVPYPYTEIKAIHCRVHVHKIEPVSVCDVVQQTFRLIKANQRSGDRYVSQVTKIDRASVSTRV